MITPRQPRSRGRGEGFSASRAFLENTRALALELSIDGTLLDITTAMIQCLGIRPDPVLGETLGRYLPPEVRSRLEEVLHRVTREPSGFRCDFHRDHRLYDWSVTPRFDSTGQVASVAILGWDITRHIQHPPEPARAEAGRVDPTPISTPDKVGGAPPELSPDDLARQQWVILEAVPMGVSHIVDRRILWANRAHHVILGYAPGTLRGQTTSTLHVCPGEFDRIGMEAYPRLAAGGAYTTEAPLRRADGSRIWCRITGQALQPGRPEEGSIWILEDITRQRESSQEMIRQSGLIRSLLDSIPDLIFYKDPEGTYLGCNPSFAGFVGRSMDDIRGRTDHQLFKAPVADAFRENDRQMLERLAPRRNEEWITYPDGRLRLIDTLKTPYRGPDGELIGILGISRDVTDRTLAETALRESERNFRTFFDTMLDLIAVTDPSGRILCTNKAYEHALGYTAEEFSRMHVLDLHPARLRGEAEAILSDVILGKLETCPLPLAAKDGRTIPVQTRVWRGRWNGAECIFGASKDLSSELEANQRFEQLFRHNPLPMALSTLPDRLFFDVNDSFIRTLGYPKSELLGRTAFETGLFPHPDQLSSATAALQAHEHITDIELQVRCRNGALLDGLFSGDQIRSQGRAFYLTVMVDITARKNLEERLRQSSKMEAVGHLAGGMAHEFNNILGAITMELGLLQDCRLDAEALDLVQSLQSNSRRAATLIRQLLAYSRRSWLNLQNVDLASLVASELDSLHRLLGADITLEFDAPAHLPLARADRSTLVVVLEHLCRNARDAMPRGGNVSIRLSRTLVTPEQAATLENIDPGVFVSLAVSDTGCGMDERTLGSLFLPFFTTKAVGQGTGLGLAAVRGIVQQHRGWIDVASRPGAGSIFNLHLPTVA